MNRNSLFPLAISLGHGALLYGAPISWLHLRHNQVDSMVAALATLLLLGLLYGLWSSACGAAAVGWLWLVGRRRRGAQARQASPWPAVRLGLVLYALPFWLFALLYGLTYDQTVLWHPRGVLGMTAYLVLGSLVVSGVVILAMTLLSAAMRGLEQRRRLARTATALALLAFGLHVALPIINRRPEPAANALSTSSLSASDVTVADTGIDVIVVGLDGLDPMALERLIAQGQLPHFERLSRAGASGSLETLGDANSAVIWASIYTGRTPRDHGIWDFYRVRLPGTGDGLYPVHRTYFKEIVGALPFGMARRVTVTRSSLQSFPMWEVADHFGLSIGVVDGYLYSYPAQIPDTAGSYFLSNGLDLLSGLIDREVVEAVDLPLYLQPVDLFAAGELPRAPDFEWQSATLLQLLQQRPQPRLVNLYAHQPDAIQHSSWRAFEPERYWLATGEEGGGAIAELYRRFDRFLGELAELVSERTAILVVSDHGHSPTLVHSMDTQHRHGPPGAALLFGGPFRPGCFLENAHVYDIFPTVLYLLGLPVPEDAAGRVLSELLEASFVERFPVRTIASYDGLWRPEVRSVERSRELNEIELEKLRAMGYL